MQALTDRFARSNESNGENQQCGILYDYCGMKLKDKELCVFCFVVRRPIDLIEIRSVLWTWTNQIIHILANLLFVLLFKKGDDRWGGSEPTLMVWISTISKITYDYYFHVYTYLLDLSVDLYFTILHLLPAQVVLTEEWKSVSIVSPRMFALRKWIVFHKRSSWTIEKWSSRHRSRQ